MNNSKFCHLHLHNEFCLDGDAIIYNARNHYRSGKVYRNDYTRINQSKTLRHLYEHFYKGKGGTFKYNVKVFDGEKFIPSKIKNIVYSGKKNLFKLTTESGKFICASKNHKFLTKDGWKRVKELVINDMMGCNGILFYDSKDWLEEKYLKEGLNQSQISLICNCTRNLIKQRIKKFNLHKLKSEWMKGHLVKEETKNKINKTKLFNRKFLPYPKTLSSSRNRVNRWYSHLKKKCFICSNSQLRLDIHHKDGNPFNNLESNLIAVCRSCHSKNHTNKPFTVRYEKLISIKPVGIKDTYDLEVESSFHNFIANGFITHNSYLDGMGTAKQYCQKAKEMGFSHLAITNHGNTDGTIQFQKTAEEVGIKPIIGVEMYIVSDERIKEKGDKKGHITILVKNQKGWKELNKILTYANLHGFYSKPRIGFDYLLSCDLSGLIILTACSKSFLHLQNGEGFLWNLSEQMSKDSLYIELMPHSGNEFKQHNKRLKEWKEKYGLKFVATNDCHYVEKEDWKTQEVLLAIQTHSKMNDPNRWKFDIKGLHLRSANEMISAFKEQNFFSEEVYLQAMKNTMKIAELCQDFRIEKKEIVLPRVYPEKVDEFNELKKWVLGNLYKKFENGIVNNPKYKRYLKRINFELKIINEKGFVRYFLVVAKLTDWCRKNNILVGPGRGSVGGSLVAYFLKIITIDPIRYKLLFSRFVNKQRIDFPDIDLDFEDIKREKVRQYLQEQYGNENVFGISTFLTMKGRAVIRDVARAFDVPLSEVNDFAKTMPPGDNEGSLVNLHANGQGQWFLEKYPEVVLHAQKLEGQIKSVGQHSAGIVIVPPKVSFEKGTSRGNLCVRNKSQVVNWEMKDVDYVGLVKLDILGLNTLTILNAIKQQIPEIEFEKIIPNDKKIFQKISKGNTIGIFQFSTGLMTDTCKRLGIETFEDMIAAVALVRPGPMYSGMLDSYIQRKHGKNWKRKHPIYEEITKRTYGVLVYQEQIMQVISKMAGLPYSTSDEIRRVIGKKRDASEFKPYRKLFIEGCLKEKTFNKDEAIEFWNGLLEWASYGFNRAHSVEYAMLAYWTSWVKEYYPKEFICACLNYGGETNKQNYIDEAIKMGLIIIPPKIESSDAHKWKIKDNKIYTPFIEVKGIGEKTAEQCLARKKKQLGFFNIPENIIAKTRIERTLNEIKAYDIKAKNFNSEYFKFIVRN